MKRYFIKEGEEPVKEVTKKHWVNQERNAGFYPKRNMDTNEPATASFYSSNGGFNCKSIRGDILDDENEIQHVECSPEITTLLQNPPVLLEE